MEASDPLKLRFVDQTYGLTAITLPLSRAQPTILSYKFAVLILMAERQLRLGSLDSGPGSEWTVGFAAIHSDPQIWWTGSRVGGLWIVAGHSSSASETPL